MQRTPPGRKPETVKTRARTLLERNTDPQHYRLSICDSKQVDKGPLKQNRSLVSIDKTLVHFLFHFITAQQELLHSSKLVPLSEMSYDDEFALPSGAYNIAICAKWTYCHRFSSKKLLSAVLVRQYFFGAKVELNIVNTTLALQLW